MSLLLFFMFATRMLQASEQPLCFHFKITIVKLRHVLETSTSTRCCCVSSCWNMKKLIETYYTSVSCACAWRNNLKILHTEKQTTLYDKHNRIQRIMWCPYSLPGRDIYLSFAAEHQDNVFSSYTKVHIYYINQGNFIIRQKRSPANFLMFMIKLI